MAEGPGDGGEVEQLERVERVEVVEHVLDRPGPAAGGGRQVVAGDQLTVGLDAGDELVELQREQPAVGAELDDVALDLAGDPAHHLEPLGDGGDVAHGDQVLDLQRRQRAGHLVEAQLVALEGGQRLVGPGQDLGRVLEHVALTGRRRSR